MGDRLSDLRADYAVLGEKLREAGGSGAAALVRERRALGELIDRLSASEEVPLVDQLTANVVALAPARRPRAKTSRSSA